MTARAKSVETPRSLLEEPVPTPEELAENEAAWEEEVLRIAREHDEGRAQFLPWEEVRARVFDKRG